MYQPFSQPAQIYYQTIWQLSTAFSHFFAKLLQSLKTNWTYSRKPSSHDTQQFFHLWVSASLWLRFCPFTAFSPENLWLYHIFSEYFGYFHLGIFYMPNLSYFYAAMHQMLPANCHTAQESPAFCAGNVRRFRCHFCQTEKARKTDLSIFRVSNISY